MCRSGCVRRNLERWRKALEAIGRSAMTFSDCVSRTDNRYHIRNHDRKMYAVLFAKYELVDGYYAVGLECFNVIGKNGP